MAAWLRQYEGKHDRGLHPSVHVIRPLESVVFRQSAVVNVSPLDHTGPTAVVGNETLASSSSLMSCIHLVGVLRPAARRANMALNKSFSTAIGMRFRIYVSARCAAAAQDMIVAPHGTSSTCIRLCACVLCMQRLLADHHQPHIPDRLYSMDAQHVDKRHRSFVCLFGSQLSARVRVYFVCACCPIVCPSACACWRVGRR